mgnify:CR=1 FL=1
MMLLFAKNGSILLKFELPNLFHQRYLNDICVKFIWENRSFKNYPIDHQVFKPILKSLGWKKILLLLGDVKQSIQVGGNGKEIIAGSQILSLAGIGNFELIDFYSQTPGPANGSRFCINHHLFTQ